MSPASRGTGAAAVAGAGAGDAWRGSAVAFAGLGTARRRRISSPRAWAMRLCPAARTSETLRPWSEEIVLAACSRESSPM